MKFTLKNRPKLEKYTAGVYSGFYKDENCRNLEKWFVGFEKELREMLRFSQKWTSTRSYNYVERMIKEILGE